MKKIAALAAFMAFSFQVGLSQETTKVPAAVSAIFKMKYPNAKHLSWQKDGDNYAARFYMREGACTARFNQKGEWLDETRKMNFGELRNNVRNAFSQGKFSSWRAYEVNEIQQRNKDVQYRILVKSTNEAEQRYLLYDAKGQMINVLTM